MRWHMMVNDNNKNVIFADMLSNNIMVSLTHSAYLDNGPFMLSF